MKKNLSHIQKLEIYTKRRNNLVLSKCRNIEKSILKNGSNLFKKYNYYIFVSVFLILYLTINIHTYFLNLHNNLGEYYHFIKQVYYSGITISLVLGVLYTYSILSYIFYPVEYKKNKKESLDPLIINFAFFLVSYIELSYKGKTDYLFDIAMIGIIPIIAFLYLVFRKVKIFVKSYNNITMKILFFVVFAFFIINSKHLAHSVDLISNDLKIKFENRVTEIYGEKKQEVLSKLVKKMNDNINHKDISIYQRDNETHLIIKERLYIDNKYEETR